MKILLVEDFQDSIDSCVEYAEMYVANGKNIDIIVAHNLKEAFQKLKEVIDIDVAIVDIKLGDSQKDGNDVINEIQKLCLRIPTVAHTGTPDDVKADVLKTFVRAEENYGNIFDYLLGVYNTGITKIIGRNGLLDNQLQEVFNKNIKPVIESWAKYSEDSYLEKGLLRYTLNHLFQLLENTDDIEKCFPEEMYIYPPKDINYRTGSIINNDEGVCFVILSPACDLALHNGNFKTEKILLAEIKKLNEIISIVTKKCHTVSEKNEKIESICRNTFSLYYHYLPKTDFFSGGIVNFRRINSFTKKELEKNFSKPSIQISPLFCKDLVSRFSSYYGRQGQPDIDYSSLLEKEDEGMSHE